MKCFLMFLSLISIIIYAIQPSHAADQTSLIIANQQLRHILEDSPSSSGIAPQKSQCADPPFSASVANKNAEDLFKYSKTNMEVQTIYEELSGRVKRD